MIEFQQNKLVENGGDFAYFLAKTRNKQFAKCKFAQDYDIVRQWNGKVAYWLAWHAPVTGWKTKDKRILDLYGGEVRRLLNERIK